jgi:Tfp pilus assembly protein PilX
MNMKKKGLLMTVCFPTGERGAVLITGLLLILVLTILSMGAMMTTAVELKIARNDRSAKQVFYIAEAGLEDVRSRLQMGASASPINDSVPSNPSWTAFVGTMEKCTENGYESSNIDHSQYVQLDPSLNYVVKVMHKLDASGIPLKWGDSNFDGRPEENTTVGESIYVITSEGYDSSGTSRPLKTEAARVPPITTPAALYTKAHTTIQGTSTNVLGMDHCGSSDVPGVVTMDSINLNGNPTITGSPSPMVEHSTMNVDVEYLVNQFKSRANHQYNVNSATLTGMTWGTPTPGATQQDALSCSSRNVVHFNTNGTYVKLSGGTQGCGILLVEGDLDVNGGFEWYGVVLVTGSIIFSGGGGKNVTGSMMAGGMVSADLVAGDANIVFCSYAVNFQTQYLPLVTLRWVELFS